MCRYCYQKWYDYGGWKETVKNYPHAESKFINDPGTYEQFEIDGKI